MALFSSRHFSLLITINCLSKKTFLRRNYSPFDTQYLKNVIIIYNLRNCYKLYQMTMMCIITWYLYTCFITHGKSVTLILPFPTLCIKSISPCCIPCQNILYCKSAFSKGCAGGEPDRFSFAVRVIEETEEEEVYVYMRKGIGVLKRRWETCLHRSRWNRWVSADSKTKNGLNEQQRGKNKCLQNQREYIRVVKGKNNNGEKMLSNFKKGWWSSGYIYIPSLGGEREGKKKGETWKGEREQRDSSGRQVRQKKCTCFWRDHSARPCHWQPVCRCYNVQKVPVAHDLEQLDYGCQGSLWSGQVGERQI